MAWDLKEPYGTTIFCDDIRTEIGNKLSYMGAYLGDMFVASPYPIVIPRLMLFCTYFDSPRFAGTEIVFNVFSPLTPPETPTFSSVATLGHAVTPDQYRDESGDSTVLVLGQIFALPPLPLDRPGKISVRAVRDGLVVRLGAIRISAADAGASG